MTCSNEECNKTVASYSLHTTCFECTTDFRDGVPCEPPTVCPTCTDAFANDEAFRKAMVKGKRDRATAKKKAKRPRKSFLETDSESNTSPHPSPAKSTYLLRLAMGFYLRLRHLTVTCIYPAFLLRYSCRHRRLVCERHRAAGENTEGRGGEEAQRGRDAATAATSCQPRTEKTVR